ncbi:uncharacterized protein MONOS_11084 [Monocercomonoides exilis]|uniref:uncharacterized protein n=1 Tax=Monocercomonoides exilis TaxID=2049356 RepID=UPI00355A6301|nr:hypothetical protein MONOS_11084 [Monocercomonoides exilis]|eukprot:MONOS_11084.1-p1 / transcript=MONOS_11084.1 / gene=MONOS_11084 / organism=Monocercomonoides_exilis_PA203 / gene_product=unspecified product / transcript_product=unspecified product / location=Mono_scaffold00536:19348-19756(-) / protein_length=67 / sequence_SO=supercontig / SO=protein_coding / is_pseudo=false
MLLTECHIFEKLFYPGHCNFVGPVTKGKRIPGFNNRRTKGIEILFIYRRDSQIILRWCKATNYITI